MSAIPTVFLTGTVATGKTAVAAWIGRELAEARLPVAVVDLDWLGWTHFEPGSPSPDDLIARNLAAIWPNFRAAGMGYAVLARALTSRRLLETLASVVPDAEITVVRLTALPATIERRLRLRDTAGALEEHLREAGAMASRLEQMQLGGFEVATDGQEIQAVALGILRQLGWIR